MGDAAGVVKPPRLVEEELSRAWFYEETSKLACTYQCVLDITADECREESCAHMAVFQMLHRKRQLHRASLGDDALLFKPRPLSEPRSARGDAAVDVLLLVGDMRHDVGLRSLLANRGCSLRLHVIS